MSVDGTPAEGTRPSPAGASPLVGLLGVAFLAGGIFFGLLPLAHMGVDAWQARSYRPVTGAVLAVSSVHGRSKVSRIQARYRYVFRGRSYESERIGVGPAGADNIGRWQRDWEDRLVLAKERGDPITVWVDPRKPERALLDRDLRWGKVLFHQFFALVFGAIGLLAVVGWARSVARSFRAHPVAPPAGIEPTSSA